MALRWEDTYPPIPAASPVPPVGPQTLAPQPIAPSPSPVIPTPQRFNALPTAALVGPDEWASLYRQAGAQEPTPFPALPPMPAAPPPAPKPKPFFSLSDVGGALWEGATTQLVPGIKSAVAQAYTGLDRPDLAPDWAKQWQAEGRAATEESQRRIAELQAQGTATSVGESIREAMPSMGFSLASMGAAIPGALAGGAAGSAVPGIGTVAGGMAGAGAASGAAAYRMAGAQLLDQSFAELDAQSMKERGRPLDEAEKQHAYDTLLPIAQNTGLWEAGPEAIGNAAMLGLGKIALNIGMKAAPKLLQRVGAAAAGIGTEVGTEGVTQYAQGNNQARVQAAQQALLSGGDVQAAIAKTAPQYEGLGGLLQATQEVAPATLATVGLMGAGAKGIQIAGKAIERRGNNAQAEALVKQTTPEAVQTVPDDAIPELLARARALQDAGNLSAKPTRDLDNSIETLAQEADRRLAQVGPPAPPQAEPSAPSAPSAPFVPSPAMEGVPLGSELETETARRLAQTTALGPVSESAPPQPAEEPNPYSGLEAGLGAPMEGPIAPRRELGQGPLETPPIPPGMPTGQRQTQTLEDFLARRAREGAPAIPRGIPPTETQPVAPRSQNEEAQAQAETLLNPPPPAREITPQELGNVDLTTNAAPAEAGIRTVEVPLDRLTLSEDVPQFKEGASAKTGVVEPLGGKFDRTGVAPIIVWERADGRQEIISGRHRADLARRSNEKTIPAQVFREKDGFTAQQAAIMDAELNIRDGQGSVKDYVRYFQGSGLTQEEANLRGLVSRSLGKTAFTIANDGTQELIGLHLSGRVSDKAAFEIARSAPGDARLQAVGLKAVAEGKSAENAGNLIQAVKTLAAERGMPADASADLFGFDDSAMKEAATMAGLATKRQRQLSERLTAIKGAAKHPEIARSEGIDVKDEAALAARIEQLTTERAAWDRWATTPELIGQIRAEMAAKAPTRTPVAPVAPVAPKTPKAPAEAPAPAPLLASYSKADLDARAAAERAAADKKAAEDQAAADKAAADAARGGFNLTGSERPADLAAAAGQTNLLGQMEAPKPVAKLTRAPEPVEAARPAVEKPAPSSSITAETPYKELVRLVEAGSNARRTLGDMPDAKRKRVEAFQKSGLPATRANVRKVLGTLGISGAIEPDVAHVLKHLRLAQAQADERLATIELRRRETKPLGESNAPAIRSPGPSDVGGRPQPEIRQESGRAPERGEGVPRGGTGPAEPAGTETEEQELARFFQEELDKAYDNASSPGKPVESGGKNAGVEVGVGQGPVPAGTGGAGQGVGPPTGATPSGGLSGEGGAGVSTGTAPRTGKGRAAPVRSGTGQPGPENGVSRNEQPGRGGETGGTRVRPERAATRKATGAAAPTVSQSLASAGIETTEGLIKTMDALAALFGGNGKLSSGLTFDEDTYRKAVPLFKEALGHFGKAIKDVKEAIRLLIAAMRDLGHSKETLQTMQPYAIRFAQDMVSGKLEPEPEPETIQIARPVETRADKQAAQRAAESIAVKPRDADNIRATLPYLLPEQQTDVLKAEQRFEAHDGILFTNGTGSGKTYTGLGIIKRMVKEGKDNILIVVPSQTKASDWANDARNLGLAVSVLEDTQDAGTGIVVTTYANFYDNDALDRRTWDGIVYDESHKLGANAAGAKTVYMDRHERLTGRPNGLTGRAESQLSAADRARRAELFAKQKRGQDDDRERLTRAEEQEMDALQAKVAANRARLESASKPKVVFLSATPFAYHQNLDYANGFLFDYGPDLGRTGYNQPNARQQFFIQHFGYSMRNNKLTAPGAEVDTDLMERRFNEHLKALGAISGRALALDQDYSREFVEIDNAMGHAIDRGINILNGFDDAGMTRDPQGRHVKKFPLLDKILEANTNFLARSRLLEGIKAKAAADRASQHLRLGRKVVVFHDYIEGAPRHPFKFSPEEGNNELNAEIAAFEQEFPELVSLPLNDLASVLNTFQAKFGDRLRVYNGRISDKKKQEALAKFNQDTDEAPVLVVQRDAGKEGISLHDVTGKKPRVLMDLGLPTAPTEAIQTEGRIYRYGQKSDAVIEYVKTNTRFEESMFARRVATRARTAENLAMGDQARNLEQAFVDAYLSSTAEAPSPTQGVGGKESDRRMEQDEPFDVARALYFANQKKTARTKAQEGIDYFATPEPLGLKMVEWAGLLPGNSVLEPSAGHGAIARWFPEDVRKTMIEPSGELSARLGLNARGHIVTDRFENLNPVNKYDAIVMNPPFGTASKTAFDHLEKAAGHLKSGGRIVALVADGPAADKRLDALLEKHKNLFPVAEFGLPAVAFERAGTRVKSRVLVLERHPNPASAPEASPRRDIDAESIDDFFNKIKDISVKPRAKPAPLETAVPTSPTAAAVLGQLKQEANKRWLAGDKLNETAAHRVVDLVAPELFYETAETKSKFIVLARGGQPVVDRSGMRLIQSGLAERTHSGLRLSEKGKARADDYTATTGPLRAHVVENFGSGAATTASRPAAPTTPAAPAPAPKPPLTVVETTHTKKSQAAGRPVPWFAVPLPVKIPDAEYQALAAQAKAQGGFYSSYRSQGAVPGFQFATREKAEAFVAAANSQRFSLPTGTQPGSTVAQARTQLGEALGAAEVAAMEQDGRLVLHETDPTGKGAAGYVDAKGVIHLIPSNLRGDAASVVLHEETHLLENRPLVARDATVRLAHATLRLMGLENFIGTPTFADLVKQAHALADAGNETALRALAQARDVAPEAVDSEFLAYLVEYAPPTNGLVRRILAAIRAVLYRMGVKIDLTPADVRAIARSAFQARAAERQAASVLSPATRYSEPDFAPTDEEKTEIQRQMDAVEEVRDSQGRLLAPNGRPSNLTERQWKQVRTPWFQNWFGDWQNEPGDSSRVVDGNGEPKVVYHGTTAAGFSTFGQGQSAERFFFTDSLALAKTYSNTTQEASITGRRGTHGVHGVYPVFLNLRNPLTHDFKGENWLTSDTSTDAEAVKARRLGRDGTVFKNVNDPGLFSLTNDEVGTVYVAFEPNQAKSATQNTGMFNRWTGDLRYSKSPRVRRTVAELLDGMDRMKDWHDWYDRHDAALARMFGDDAALFQDMLSATSQAASVATNVPLALKAYRQLKTGEPFQGYLPAVIKNLERIRAQGAVQGAKIGEYSRANQGVESAIAVDRHIAMLFFDTKTPNRAQIQSAKTRINTLAKQSGFKPREVQAILWAYNQVLRGADPTQVKSYDTLLERRADEIAALRSAFADAGREGSGLPERGDAVTEIEGIRYSFPERSRQAIAGTQSFLARLKNPLEGLPQLKDYMIQRYLALGRVSEARKETERVYRVFSQAPEAIGKQIYEFLTTAGATPASIADPQYRAEAIKLKQQIDALGQRAVEAGAISQTSYLKYKDQYLPRLYLRHLLKDEDVAAMMGSTGKKPDLGWTKHRKDIPEEIRRLVLGEIKDPAYLASQGVGTELRDMALLDWMQTISQNEKWVWKQSLVNFDGHQVTPFWLLNEAKQIRTQIPYYDEADRAAAWERVRRMEDAGQTAAGGRPEVPEGYRAMPDSPRYGKLRGMVVRQEIYDDIVGATSINTDASLAERVLGDKGALSKGIALWKWSKVAANPPSQIRNFISNAVLLHLSGVPFYRVPGRILEAWKQIRTNGSAYQIAQEHGVTESSYTNQELRRIDTEFMDAMARQGKLTPWQQMRLLFDKVYNATGDLYQFSESLYKTAKIIDELEKGRSASDAALAAHEALFDYSLVSPSVRYLRNAPLGAPFATFALKVLPMLLDTLRHHPLRFAPYIAIPYLLSAMLAGAHDLDDDDVKSLETSLPKWLREKAHAWFLPFKDANGRWQAMDFGYFLPWTLYTDVLQKAAQGKPMEALMTLGVLGSPIIGITTALQTGKDPFTQKDIWNKYDPPAVQVATIMNYVWRTAMPTFMTDIGFAGKLAQAAGGSVDKYGEPSITTTQAMARLLGVNLYSVNPELSRAKNLMFMQSDMAKTKSRMALAMKDPNLTPEQRRSIARAYLSEIQDRAREMADYARESRITPAIAIKKPEAA